MTAQPLPLGTWRTHFTYHNATGVYLGQDRVYASTSNSLFYREEQTMVALAKGGALSDAEVTAVAVDPQGERTVVGYANGNLDWFTDSEKINFPTIKDADRSGDKAIYDLFFRGDTLYICSGVGVVLLNPRTERVLGSWLQLGPEASNASVFQGAIANDSIFLATSVGVLSNSLDYLVNRQDWTTWRRSSLPTQSQNAGVRLVARHARRTFACNSSSFLYSFDGKRWQLDRTFPRALRSLRTGATGQLLAVTSDSLYVRNASGGWLAFGNSRYQQLSDARQDDEGTYWLADAAEGLVWLRNLNWQSGYPAGPPTDRVEAWAGVGSGIFAVPGGNSNGNGFQLPGQAFGWTGSEWVTRSNDTLPRDWSAIAQRPNTDSLYVAAFGSGLGAFTPTSTAVTPQVGAPFVAGTGNPPYRFTDVAFSASGELWTVQTQGTFPLYRRAVDGAWSAYSINDNRGAFVESVTPTFSGLLFLTLSPAAGGGLLVYDPDRDTARQLTPAQELPGNTIYSVVEDNNGFLWVGGNDGVSVFTNPSEAFSPSFSAERPRVEFREAFVGVPVFSIQIDGGDRLWLGTNQGAWLLDGLGNGVLQQFTTANSPLPSDIITQIGHVPATGEVFFGTSNGIASYQGNAPLGGNTHSSALKVFPNPVSPGFSGSVAIQGLSRNAFLRVTDLAGNRIRDLEANGSMATWNLQDVYGQRVPAGVYLLVGTTRTGDDSILGRIVVQE